MIKMPTAIGPDGTFNRLGWIVKMGETRYAIKLYAGAIIGLGSGVSGLFASFSFQLESSFGPTLRGKDVVWVDWPWGLIILLSVEALFILGCLIAMIVLGIRIRQRLQDQVALISELSRNWWPH